MDHFRPFHLLVAGFFLDLATLAAITYLASIHVLPASALLGLITAGFVVSRAMGAGHGGGGPPGAAGGDAGTSSAPGAPPPRRHTLIARLAEVSVVVAAVAFLVAWCGGPPLDALRA